MKSYNEWLIHSQLYETGSLEIRDLGSVSVLNRDFREEILDIITVELDQNSPNKLVFTKVREVLKRVAHIEGLLHMAAHIWIFNSNGEVLIQRRSLNKDSYPGLWDISVAGHISSGETMIDGAIREIKEEIGLKEINKEDLVLTGYYREEVQLPMKGYETGWHNNELNGIFLYRFDGVMEDLKMQEDEVEEIKFITVARLEEEWLSPEKELFFVPKGENYKRNIIRILKEATLNIL